MGRIGLAISPVDADVLYAIVEAAGDAGGFFRSTDAGANWEKRSDYVSGSPQYYQEIVADPRDRRPGLLARHLDATSPRTAARPSPACRW